MKLNEMLKNEAEKMNLTDVNFVCDGQLEVGCGHAFIACGGGGNGGEG